MNYIINPAWVYWLGVVDNLITALLVGLILSLVCGICTGAIMISNLNYQDDNDFIVSKKIFKISLIISAVIGVALVFTPSGKTLIEMQIAKAATVENAEQALEAVKKATDYVIESIGRLR